MPFRSRQIVQQHTTCIPSSTEQTIGELLHTTSKQMSIEYANTQCQKGSSECGSFAIGTATALVHGYYNPYQINLIQEFMQEHLMNAGVCTFSFSTQKGKKKQGTFKRGDCSILQLQTTR